jgi:hypothetical protein
MIQAANEFIGVIDHIYGVYLDSTQGFYHVREKLIETQQIVSKQTSKSIEDLDNVKYTYGVGDSRNSDSYVLHECTQSQLKKGMKTMGIIMQLLQIFV